MNKLRLLLSAGAMLSLTVGAAHAGRLMDMTGNPTTPTGTGTAVLPDGFVEMGGPYTGGQGLETETAAPFSVAAPGTINMRINSFVNEFPMYTTWTGMNGSGTPAANSGNKQQGYGIYGWIRVDIGIDGQTKNGIKYGAFTEIRENNTTNITGGTASISGVTGSATTGLAGTSVSSGFAQSAASDSADNTLYVRHAFTYIGTDQLGFIRIGTGFGAQTSYEVGLFDDFDIGGWISFASSNIPSNMTPIWPWADEGGEYMAARVGYFSPTFAGFDFGVDFAPTNAGPFDGSGCSAAYGGMGCTTQSTSLLSGDYARYRNEVGISGRYRNTFGPFGLAAAGTWTTSGKVNEANVSSQPYKGFNIGDVGATVQFNNLIEVGGNVMWGAFNGNWGLQPAGGDTALAYVAGVKYTIAQLPATLGAYYFHYSYNGITSAVNAGMGARVSQGLDVGAVYGLGPGVVLIAEYAWGQNSQSGYNFLTGACAATTGACSSHTGAFADNTVTAQVFTLGMSVRF